MLSKSDSVVQNYATTIATGGNAVLAALSGDLKARGATLTADGSASLYAARTLDLGAVTNSQSSSISGKKKGFLTHSNFSNAQSSTTEVGTTVAVGKDLNAVSGGDMHVAGTAGAAGDVTLQSGGASTEDALHSTTEQSSSTSTYTPGVVASTGGSLMLSAKGPVAINDSALSAEDDLAISGSSVAFNSRQNTATQSMIHKDKSIGMTVGLSPGSMIGQAVNGALAAQHSSTGVQSTLSGIQTGLGEGMTALGDGSTNNIIGAQNSLGFSRNKSKTDKKQTTVQGLVAQAGGTLSVVARGDTAGDAQSGTISATASHLSAQDVILAAKKDITLQSGVNTEETQSTSSSRSLSTGVQASAGLSHSGVSVTASASASHSQTHSESVTHVDTTITASHEVSLSASEETTLHGAEINGERITLKSGLLTITSPQDTASYSSDAQSGGFGVSIPIPGAGVGAFGGSASVSAQTINDTYRSTGPTQSGLYAGKDGIDVDVGGDTTLTAAVISSTADNSLNHFHTGSLATWDVDNQSSWSGTSVTAGGGFSSAGSLSDAARTITLGAGHVDHDERTVTQSVITGNIVTESQSHAGSYSTDLDAANGHLDNNFNAQKLSNTPQTQTSAETAVETAVELGYQAYHQWGGSAKEGQLKEADKSEDKASDYTQNDDATGSDQNSAPSKNNAVNVTRAGSETPAPLPG